MNMIWEFSNEGAQKLVEDRERWKPKVELGNTRRPSAMVELKATGVKLEGAMAYYRAWRCASQMLADRGYDIDPRPFDITFTRFLKQHGLDAHRDPSQPDLDRLQITASAPAKVLVVFFAADVTVSVDTLRGIYAANQTDLPSRVIIVAHAALLPKVHLRAIVAVCPFKVEMFHLSQLYSNLMRDHVKMGLTFRALTVEEKTALFFNSAKVKVQVLRMPPESAIAQYYALEDGMVLEATKVDPALVPTQAGRGQDNEEAAVDDADAEDVGVTGDAENDDSDLASDVIPSELMGEGPHYLVLAEHVLM